MNILGFRSEMIPRFKLKRPCYKYTEYLLVKVRISGVTKNDAASGIRRDPHVLATKPAGNGPLLVMQPSRHALRMNSARRRVVDDLRSYYQPLYTIRSILTNSNIIITHKEHRRLSNNGCSSLNFIKRRNKVSMSKSSD